MLRMTLLLIAFCVQLSGCGSARTPTTDVKSQVAADLGQAAARTVGAHTATFRLMVAAGFHGAVVRTESGGSVSFVAHQAHVYKVVPGDPVPEEEIIDGHLVYAN